MRLLCEGRKVKKKKKKRGEVNWKGRASVDCGLRQGGFFCKGDGRQFAAPAMINFSLAITRSIGGFSELGRYKGTCLSYIGKLECGGGDEESRAAGGLEGRG